MLVVRQGFKCNEQEYYLVAYFLKKPKYIPIIGKYNGRYITCKKVQKTETGMHSHYITPDNIPEEVSTFIQG